MLDVVLGKGIFGEVRLGEYWGTKVAVKFLRDVNLEEHSALFRKEIQTMQELRHPHIVQFLGYSSTPERGPVILMEVRLHAFDFSKININF